MAAVVLMGIIAQRRALQLFKNFKPATVPDTTQDLPLEFRIREFPEAPPEDYSHYRDPELFLVMISAYKQDTFCVPGLLSSLVIVFLMALSTKPQPPDVKGTTTFLEARS